VTYLEELRHHGVCSIQAALNQHLGGHIEVCDTFWPYEKVLLSTKSELAGYIEQTRRLLGARCCIGTAFTQVDERLAAALFERKIPIEDIEHGVLLGCARKYVALINHQSRHPIVSFSYR
jgi:cobalamin biosynthesis protein CbiG